MKIPIEEDKEGLGKEWKWTEAKWERGSQLGEH